MQKERLDSAFFSVQRTLKQSLRKIMSCPQDIEDVIQETYLRAVANNTSNSIKDPEAYLFRASRNIALNEKARMYRHLEAALPREELEELSGMTVDRPVENDVQRKQEFAELCLAVSELPIQCRKVFVLRKVYGLSQIEIANKLGISVSTVETHVTKGMHRTRKALNKRRSSEHVPAVSYANEQ